MLEQHFFADVNLPFHVWVRERAGARGYKWVLRSTSEMGAAGAAGQASEAANDPGPAPKRSAS